MALTVNTNIASLTAQRNLTGSQNSLSTSLQRLSSGLRINSAKDDAAGLAISERFTAQIRGLNQGVRNANDGISLAQTAEGALKEVTSNLQRIREIAVQSANATNSDSDRVALQAEVAQLVAEIDRVAQRTTFNGIALLDGTFTSKNFQVGPDISSTVSIDSITSARTSALGGTFSASTTGTAGVNSTAITASTMFINGIAVTASADDGVSTVDASASALAKATAINSVTADTGVTATVVASTYTATAAADGTAAVAQSFEINGQLISYTTTGAAPTTADAAVAAVNAQTNWTGVSATADSAGIVTFSAADGRNIRFTDVAAGGGLAELNIGGAGGANTTATGNLTLTGGTSAGILVSDSATNPTSAAQSAILGFAAGVNQGATGSGVSLAFLSVTNATNAQAAITSADTALDTVNSIRATLGSYQSRFESVVANLQTTSENLSASRSRILDADFAAETANLTKAQILQQSGIAMLAQANAIPQNVLALLQ
jgi:flagellin